MTQIAKALPPRGVARRGVDTVRLLDVSLSAQCASDGQVLRAGYLLSAEQPVPAQLHCGLLAPDAQPLDDLSRVETVLVGPPARWYYRDFLVNAGPGPVARRYTVEWQVRSPDFCVAHSRPKYLRVALPRPVRVPILMYHHVGPKRERWWVSQDDFHAQMQALREDGHTGVTLQEVMDCRAGLRDLPERPVLITFDDGGESVYTEGFPILSNPSIHLKATVFVITGSPSRPDVEAERMDWGQVQTLHDSGRIDIQSHTVTHPMMSTLSGQPLLDELFDSRAEIESRLQKEVRYLAWPYGDTSRAAQTAAREAGYFATLSACGGFEMDCAQKWGLRRISVEAGAFDIPVCPAELLEHPGPLARARAALSHMRRVVRRAAALVLLKFIALIQAVELIELPLAG